MTTEAARRQPHKEGDRGDAREQVEDAELAGNKLVQRIKPLGSSIGSNKQGNADGGDDGNAGAEARPVNSALFHSATQFDRMRA